MFQQLLKLSLTMKQNDFKPQIKEALTERLSSIPFLSFSIEEDRVIGANFKVDFFVEIKTKEDNYYFLVETKNTGFPRIAREAAYQLESYKRFIKNSYGIFAAPYISPDSAEICRNFGIGFLDDSGNCSINYKNIFIQIQGKPNLFNEKRILKSLYSPKAERALRILLDSKTEWYVQDLAKKADISLGLASNIKKILLDKEFAQSDGYKFRIIKPEELLKEWADNYTYRKNKIQNFFALLSNDEFEDKFSEICYKYAIQYAFTGFSSAERYASFVRYNRSMAYAGNGKEKVISELNLKTVPSGANFTMLEPYDEGVFINSKKIKNMSLVSPIQTYLDLINYQGRGEEAANYLLQEVIKKSW